MAFKTILSRLTSNKETKKETFLALEISPEAIKSVVWTVDEGETMVLKMGSVEEWEEDDKNSLITAVDASITNAIETIDPEPNKVIFGLPEGWVEDSQIAEGKKGLLKDLCSKLALQPLGFVVTLEALITFLRIQKGTPINAIFINLSETQIIVSLVHLGKIKGSEMVGRSEDLAADVREGLARFGDLTDLPSLMVLFNGIADFEEAKQQLISFDWPQHLPFLHFPKIEDLEQLISVKAIAIAGGAEVAKSLGFEIKEIEDKKIAPEIEKETEDTEEKETSPILQQNSVSLEVSELTAADFGFIQDKDITKEKVSTFAKASTFTKVSVDEAADKEQVDESLAVGRQVDEVDKVSSFSTKEADTEDKEKVEEEKEKEKEPLLTKFKKIIDHLFFFRKVSFKIPELSFKKVPLLIILAFLFIILVGIGGGLFFWYVPKATVTLYLKPKILEKELQITVDPTFTDIDQNKGIIPGSLKEVEVEGDKTKETTGEKLVGDKAKGKVIIYNKTDVAKNFSAGTVLIGPDKLTFTLGDSVTIASESAQAEGVTYGKLEANITASSIGTESNLPAQTQFSFKEYPTSLYSAKTDNGLSGGTSRQIRAVAKSDQTTLLDDLTLELALQAKEQLSSQLTSAQEVLGKEAKTEVVSKKFSTEVDEEADDLNLKLKIKFTFLVYQKDKLDQLIAKTVANDIPESFVLDPQTTTIETKEIEVKKDKAVFKAIIKVNLLPKVNVEEIKNNLKGRYPEIVRSYLESLPNFSQADIKITPKLPAKLSSLPRLTKNINVVVKIME